MSLTTTLAPRAASSRACARPILGFPPAPVITAVRPSKRNGSMTPIYSFALVDTTTIAIWHTSILPKFTGDVHVGTDTLRVWLRPAEPRRVAPAMVRLLCRDPRIHPLDRVDRVRRRLAGRTSLHR